MAERYGLASGALQRKVLQRLADFLFVIVVQRSISLGRVSKFVTVSNSKRS
jgi:hypothetical protein